MKNPFIFVSCGQFTEAEKGLGKSIVRMVRELSGRDAFFAENVQDLNGLDSNILGALRECDGFITVMHPRGEILWPDGSKHVRASVWIEQEIAVAAYIQRLEGRELPVIAFVHQSIGLEGIRELLHLNPERFLDESDVLAALPSRLLAWRNLSSSGVNVKLRSVFTGTQEGHRINKLAVEFVNETNRPIRDLNGLLKVPARILKHWSAHYVGETKCDEAGYRCFRFDEKNSGREVLPHDARCLFSLDYCTACALEPGDFPAAVAEATVRVKVWVEGREYWDENTMKGLSVERDRTLPK